VFGKLRLDYFILNEKKLYQYKRKQFRLSIGGWGWGGVGWGGVDGGWMDG
jgi:hypothetical protein